MINKFELFKKFHEENPHIYINFCQLSEQVFKLKDRYSAWGLFCVIRFNHEIKTSGDEFKVNNNFIAYYTRLLIIDKPKFKDFFKIKDGKDMRFLTTGDFEEILVESLNSLF